MKKCFLSIFILCSCTTSKQTTVNRSSLLSVPVMTNRELTDAFVELQTHLAYPDSTIFILVNGVMKFKSKIWIDSLYVGMLNVGKIDTVNHHGTDTLIIND